MATTSRFDKYINQQPISQPPTSDTNVSETPTEPSSRFDKYVDIQTPKERKMGELKGQLEQQQAEKPPSTASFFPSALGETLKQGAGIVGDYFKNIIPRAFKAVRAGSQALASPFSAALAQKNVAGSNMYGGGEVTPKQAWDESLKMAANTLKDSNSTESAIDAGMQEWLRLRGVGKYGGKNPDIFDLGAAIAIKSADLFGDPLADIPALFAGSKAFKEFVIFKKVGTATRELPEGASFMQGTMRDFEIPLNNDLKVRVKPKENSIVFEGFQRRFSKTPTEPGNLGLPAGNLEANKIVSEVSKMTDVPMTSEIVNGDLIIRPVDQVANVGEKISSAVPQEVAKTTQPEVIPQENIKQELPKDTIVHGTTPENLAKIQTDGFKPGKNSIFGVGASFTDNQKVRELYGNSTLEVDPTKLNLKVFESRQEWQDFVDSMGADNLSQALQKEGKYDGAVITNPNPEVGNLYFVTNMDRLNEQILGKAPATTPAKAEPDTTQAPETSLIEEAKKYKTPEEFVNAQTNAYHGTLADFENFDNKKVGSNTGWENAKFGTFFLDDATKAKEFPELARMSGDSRTVKVKEAYIELKNPIDLTIKGIFNNEKQAPTIVQLLGGEKMSPKDALDFLNENIGLGEIGDLKDALYGDIKNKAIMQKAGYDGIISDYGDGIIEKVVFDTSQIKTKSQLTDIWNKARKTKSTQLNTSEIQRVADNMQKNNQELVRSEAEAGNNVYQVRIKSDIVKNKSKFTNTREEELIKAIDKKIESTRKEMGLMANREGAGSIQVNVKDAVGHTNFTTNYFKLSKAKKSMAAQAKNSKEYVKNLLIENDPEFKNMVDELNAITESKPIEEVPMPQFSLRGIGNASFASKGGRKSINKMIDGRTTETISEKKPELISKQAKQVLKDLGIPMREKTLASRFLGVFKPMSKNVRVQSMYDVTTVVHEASHALDNKHKLYEKMITETGRGERIRRELTDIYTKLYAGGGVGKPTHSLKIRLKEGYATLIENYFYDPSGIIEQYPYLVDNIIKPGGKYYLEDTTKLLKEMNKLVDEYARLSPEQRIASRVRTGEEVIKSDSGFSWKQRAIFETFNKLEPLQRYAKIAGVNETWEDPTIQAFTNMNKNAMVVNWYKGEYAPILKSDGNFDFSDATAKKYMDLIKGKEREFSSYLIARRVVADHNKLMKINDKIAKENIVGQIEEIRKKIKEDETGLTAIAVKKDLAELQSVIDERDRIKEIINNDDFGLQDSTAVIEKYGTKFGDAEKIYDEINRNLIDLAHNTGLIDLSTAEKYKAEEGYTSFRRYIDDELNSHTGTRSGTKSKVSSFKERTGSNLDIIDPIYNQLLAINEIMSKGMENMLWTKVANLAKKSPEVAQRFELIETKTAVDNNGQISYPQDRDPNLIRIWKNGKREFYKPAPEFVAVMKTMQPQEMDGFALLLKIPSSVFTRLTTSANPLFAISNLTVDQFTAAMQTKTGFKPIIDPVKSFGEYLKELVPNKGIFAKFKSSDSKLKQYMTLGGKHQTLASFLSISPEDLPEKYFKEFGKKTSLIKKTAKVIDSAIGVLEMPSNLSEILTRFSEYRRAIDAGDSQSLAMYKAAQVTVPFQLQGKLGGRVGREYVKSIPYFNAAIQVLYKFGKTTKEHPLRVGTMAAGLGIAALTSAIGSMMFASDRQKRLLAEQPVRMFNRYLFLPALDGETLIRIRIPEQMGGITGAAYLYVIQHYGLNKAHFEDYFEVATAGLPDQIKLWHPKEMVSSLLPQVLAPSAKVAFNVRDYPDIRPIVPDYMKYKKPSERYTTYTSNVAKFLGQLTNSSPALIDYWIGEQFGTLGNALLGNMPSNPIYIQEQKYIMTGRAYNNFYDIKGIADQQYDEMRDNPKAYSSEQIMEISTAHKAYGAVDDILKEMRKLGQQKNFNFPEDIRQKAYDLLLTIDKKPATQELYDKAIALKISIYDLK